MAIVNNKDLIQSYIITTAKYDFSVPEKRIIYRIIESLQHLVQGKELNKQYKISDNLFGDYRFEMPISAFLKDKETKITKK